MIHKIPLENLVFFDIETVPATEEWEQLDPEMQQLWEEKTRYQRREEYSAEEFYQRAGIWAEFGKIICISIGYFNFKNGMRQLRITSLYGEEKDLLQQLSNMLSGHFKSPNYVLCGHNIKEFDIPYLCRRFLIHGLAMPEKLNLFGKKPWEIPHLDTMEMWKFGDYKSFTSLKLLTKILGVPSPKDDIDGSEVAQVFYKENDIDRIIRYCEKDVVAVAQVVLRFRGEEICTDDEIFCV